MKAPMKRGSLSCGGDFPHNIYINMIYFAQARELIATPLDEDRWNFEDDLWFLTQCQDLAPTELPENLDTTELLDPIVEDEAGPNCFLIKVLGCMYFVL